MAEAMLIKILVMDLFNISCLTSIIGVAIMNNPNITKNNLIIFSLVFFVGILFK